MHLGATMASGHYVAYVRGRNVAGDYEHCTRGKRKTASLSRANSKHSSTTSEKTGGLFRKILLTMLFIVLLAPGLHGACYQKLQSGGLSCQEKEGIVSMHNTLRQRVALGSVSGQPPASNMLEMAWDEELANKAQSWADSCPAGHDSNSARRVGRFNVGQNIAKTWSSSGRSYVESPNFSSQINAWFNEVYQYSFGRGGAGHYSQMVWGDSHLVGCGFTQYMDGTRNTKMYVCNYGPGGNVVGRSPYRPGQQSCSQIGATPSRRYSGLCELPGTRSSSACYGGGGSSYAGYSASAYSGYPGYPGYSGYSGYNSYYYGGGYRRRHGKKKRR